MIKERTKMRYVCIYVFWLKSCHHLYQQAWGIALVAWSRIGQISFIEENARRHGSLTNKGQHEKCPHMECEVIDKRTYKEAYEKRDQG